MNPAQYSVVFTMLFLSFALGALCKSGWDSENNMMEFWFGFVPTIIAAALIISAIANITRLILANL